MMLIKYKPVILDALARLRFNSNYITGATSVPYEIKGLTNFRQILKSLIGVPGIVSDINSFERSWIFETRNDSMRVAYEDDTLGKTLTTSLLTKLGALNELIEVEESKLHNLKLTLSVYIPEIDGFTALEKYAEQLQKAIELPVIDDHIEGEVKIVAGGQGSVVLIIFVGSISALKLIAHLCRSAAVTRKTNMEANFIKEQTRTLKVKNDVLDAISEAIIIQQKEVVHREAEAIATGHYPKNDPELVERLKLSIVTMAVLLDKGVKILPTSSESSDSQKLDFPDYDLLNVASSPTKQIEKESESH